MYNNGSVQALYQGVGLCLIGTDDRNETILLTFLRPGDPIGIEKLLSSFEFITYS